MGLRLLSIAAALAALLAGCYQPSIEPCQYRCNGEACPSDLACNADHWCAASKSDVCGDVIDAPVTIDARPDASCGWNVTNFDVCLAGIDGFGPSQDWIIPVGATVTIDTGSANITETTGASFPSTGYKMVKVQLGAGSALTLVLGVHDLVVNGAVEVTGDNPLLIAAAGTVTIGAAIHLEPTSTGTIGCDGNAGGSGTGMLNAAGGGGGGSFGSAGAPGGKGGTMSTGGELGGMAGSIAPSDLVPLRSGCAGGRGGAWTNPQIAGGLGGKGGNGIEISARSAIRFVAGGTIIANGEGGHPTSGTSSHGGGGAGGSGGAVLLEATSIDVTGAKLCANGGGGAGSQSGTAGGTPPICAGPAMGGGTVGAPSSGGSGAANASAAQPGQMGVSTTAAEGGGGGGGGLGKIRAIGSISGTPAVASPAIAQ